ncbi:MAG: cytochrome b/b6 domain-containing protein [Deltaproteobacteria bacterium]|nr:cytochrome b/b6 domain-containing protein [Deltaproteobacteria bacterium]
MPAAVRRTPGSLAPVVIAWLFAAVLAFPGSVDSAPDPGRGRAADENAAAPEPEEQDCLSCHKTVEEVDDVDLVVDESTWLRTVHGAAHVACLDCHADADGDPHTGVKAVTRCRDCHAKSVDRVRASVHTETNGPIPAKKHPRCSSCHGKIHAMAAATDPASPVHPKHLPETCGKCHADPGLAAEAGVKLVQPIAAYNASVHANAVAAGKDAATCSSCHGTHAIRRSSDADSPTNRKNVPTTCGACHAEIAAAFATSVHGQAAAVGIREAPVCTDCHGEHRILGPSDRGSPVFASSVPKMTCGRCHGDVRLTEKFNLKATAVTAFEDSFHGLAGRAGNRSVANCASCHGVHDILQSTNPRSHVHPDNLPATCGSCHQGAGTRFALGPVHVTSSDPGTTHPVVHWVRLAYLWIIGLSIGGMVLHNVLDLRRKALLPTPRPVIPVAARRRRMSRGFRIAHALLFGSFFILVATGFALTYPEAWWATPLLALEHRFAFRGWLHRGAAIVLLVSAAFHVAHLVADPRARTTIRRMRPTLHDLRELRERIAWFFGRRPMPRSPEIGYVEKVEYLAVVWGTIIMAATGFVLWFSTWSLAHLPKWVTDVATTIHFYEAVLATLAILVWHFYFVFFDPVVYPMDSAWLTGREAPGRTLERTATPADEPAAAAPVADEPGA